MWMPMLAQSIQCNTLHSFLRTRFKFKLQFSANNQRLSPSTSATRAVSCKDVLFGRKGHVGCLRTSQWPLFVCNRYQLCPLLPPLLPPVIMNKCKNKNNRKIQNINACLLLLPCVIINWYLVPCYLVAVKQAGIHYQSSEGKQSIT